MGYPVVGAEGKIVSWGSSNFYSDLLSRITPNSCRLTVTSDTFDVTALGVARAVALAGIKSWSFTVESEAFGTPRLGSVGGITLSSGYTAHLRSWSVTVETVAVHDITPLSNATSPIEWRSWRPDMSRWSGSLTFGVDSATAIDDPHYTGDTLPSATFKYGEDTSDDTLAGTIQITSSSVSITRGSETELAVEFVGTGDLTPSGTNSPFGTSAFGIPLWSQGGTAVGPVVIAALTGSRTYTGADSFWRSLTIECAVGQPVRLTADVQGTGSLTIA